ncbi:MAG: hypothetical protein ACO23V_00740 [Chitinophagaceae bacterium]
MGTESSQNYFSLRGLLALLLSVFLAYELFQVIRLMGMAAERYNDNLFFRLFVDYLRNFSTKGTEFVDLGYTKIKIYIFVLFFGFVFKSILSFKHAFIGYDLNAKYVFYLFLVEAVLFGLFFGFNPFPNFFGNILKLSIPSLIIYGLLDE